MSDCIQPVDANVRAGRCFIARTNSACPRCHQSTPLVALVLPPGHEFLELGDDAWDDIGAGDEAGARDEAGAVGGWAAANHAALLFHVAQLSMNVRSRMASLSPAYRMDATAPGSESYWANHCEHCGVPFDDQDLFCEPGGAFCPVSEAAAQRICLLTVDEPIAAQAAGYAHEPEFFDSMSRT